MRRAYTTLIILLNVLVVDQMMHIGKTFKPWTRNNTTEQNQVYLAYGKRLQEGRRVTVYYEEQNLKKEWVKFQNDELEKDGEKRGWRTKEN